MSFLETGSWPLPIVATAEILLLLCASTVIGWLVARLILRKQIRTLKESVSERKIELATCRSIITDMPAQKELTENPDGRVSINEPELLQPDDLKIIEGIGPKIEEMLNKEGISTFVALAETSPIRLSSILKKAGPRFQIQDPSSWPEQASLASSAKWDELTALKLSLISGRVS